jgi:hypothetical protein
MDGGLALPHRDGFVEEMRLGVVPTIDRRRARRREIQPVLLDPEHRRMVGP